MRLSLALSCAAFLASAPVGADEEAMAESGSGARDLSLQLNTVEGVEGACRVTFLAQNGLGSDLRALVLEAVLFTTDGAVDRLTLFDFGTLPAGRPRVRQFDLTGLDCSALGQVLINGAAECEAEGVAPDACIEALRPSTRTDVEVTG
jgi:hypothetical protein